MSGGQFEKKGFTPATRKGLFYGVCIWIRLAMAIGVGFGAHHYPTVTSSIILAAALGALLINVISVLREAQAGPVWWSRASHAVLAGTIAVVAILVLLKKIPPATLGLFVGLDVIFGVMYSIMRRNAFC